MMKTAETRNEVTDQPKKKFWEGKVGVTLIDLLVIFVAGMVVATAYYFFQNSNNFAPGGVGGIATITYHLLVQRVSWSILMLAFNIPIFLLLTFLVNRKLGIYLCLYMLVQSLGTDFFEWVGAKPYCLANNGADFEIVFACIATGVISGFGFSMMLRRFGASGGTYAITALLKHFQPHKNIAYTAFVMDSSVVFIAFFAFGRQITPVICTLINLFVATVIVNRVLTGMRDGYRFDIITDNPEELSAALIKELKHGVTEMRVVGMYSNTDRYLVMCIIRKNQIGQMMKIIKRQGNCFASFTHVNEVIGRFKP